MKSIYPVITLYQPWATWVMRRWKGIETRTHNRFKCLEGQTFLIHAGQSTDKSDYVRRNPYLSDEELNFNPDEMVNGFILGGVHCNKFRLLTEADSESALIDCKNVERYGLILDTVNKFKEPIPAKGGMGIWYYDILEKKKVLKPQTEKLTLF